MKINELRKLIRDILSERDYDTPLSRDPIMRVAKRVEIPDETPDISTAKSMKRSGMKTGAMGSSDPLAGIIGNSKKIDDPKKSPWGHYIEDWEEEDNKLKAQNAAANLQGAIKRLNPNNKKEFEADTVADDTKIQRDAVTQKENKMKISELRNIIKEEYKKIEEEEKEKYDGKKAMRKRVEDDCRKIMRLVNDGDIETAKKVIKILYQMLDR